MKTPPGAPFSASARSRICGNFYREILIFGYRLARLVRRRTWAARSRIRRWRPVSNSFARNRSAPTSAATYRLTAVKVTEIPVAIMAMNTQIAQNPLSGVLEPTAAMQRYSTPKAEPTNARLKISITQARLLRPSCLLRESRGPRARRSTTRIRSSTGSTWAMMPAPAVLITGGTLSVGSWLRGSDGC
jgi:hypothetical protein